MNWYKVAKDEFSYNEEQKTLWRVLVGKEMSRSGIHFDLENDDVVKTRTFDLDTKNKNNEDQKFRVIAEMHVAGGDWQCPNIYFRCQLMNKYNNGTWSHGYKFVFIPRKNLNLVKYERGYTARDNDNPDKCRRYEDVLQKDLWKSVKREAEKRKKDEYKMYAASDHHDEDIWDVGFARDLLKHWKQKDDNLV